MQKALYLFCLARAGSLPVLHVDGLTDGAPLSKKDFGNISAVVGEVPLDEFCGESAEGNLQDLTWVGPRALPLRPRPGPLLRLPGRSVPP